ncbi:hypothetical protein [Nocardioides sp. CER19]|uniref:hypothetical protein n=1 Tax=Nocardioides sp. CER19 TaxID=3038538 RepID=UPI00244B0E7A|nr:hypothetical protein [Nocardioides sp. CER19]MDH2414453.1 hypothetical protein [Nocardioides sp. CER19]
MESFHQAPPPGLFPQPVECDPKSPEWSRSSKPELIKSALGAAAQVTASNAADQTFEITYISSSIESLNAYLAANSDAKTCIEAQSFVPVSADDPPLPSLEESVIDAIAHASRKSPDELAEYRDAQTTSPNLEQVAAHFGVKKKTVLSQVVGAAHTTFSGVAASTAKAAAEEVLAWDDSPPLIGSWEQPVTDDEFRQWIDKTGAVLVQIRVVDPNLDLPKSDTPDAALLSISAIFDPGVNAGKHVYYEAICSRDAWVRLHAKAGRMSVYMWRRIPYLDVGSRRASAASDANPSGIWHQSAARRTYDVLVRGWQDGSRYTLDGQWNVGSGGGC